MLFNSYEFIFLFLPLTILGYFFLNHRGWKGAAKAWLVLASLFFYSWWNVIYLPLILFSMLFNYIIGSSLSKLSSSMNPTRHLLLVAGISGDLVLLGYFKYADFFIGNINLLFSAHFSLLRLTLPLAISFFTFQQIAYLVDAYQAKAQEYDWLNYALFVSFFPHLIAGPIVHHREMMPQFASPENKSWNYENVSRGLFLFFTGLFKKVVIADTLAGWASFGFDQASSLSLLEAWIVSLSYTFQIYFDFSGYSDMALGAALMFNIRLPINFNSPYKARNIQEFWRRWHMTLSRFLRNYLYIPLGGNRHGESKLYRNLIITFLLGGLWHGAAWTFVFWGFLHGLALVIHRLWQKTGLRMNQVLAWLLCFNFVNFSWVFFRAESWSEALKVIKGMLGFSGIVLPAGLAGKLGFLAPAGVLFGGFTLQNPAHAALLLAVSLALVLFWRNSMELEKDFTPGLRQAVWVGAMALAAILSLTGVSEFLYFNF